MRAFSDFMNEWLYGKGGYYTNFKAIGKEGDFFTAVSTSAFFGASIANYLLKELQKNKIPKNVALVEIGAHQGYLMGDMIRWLYSNDASLLKSMRFIIIERQDAVIAAQKKYFAKNFGNTIKIEYYKSLKDISFCSGET